MALLNRKNVLSRKKHTMTCYVAKQQTNSRICCTSLNTEDEIGRQFQWGLLVPLIISVYLQWFKS